VEEGEDLPAGQVSLIHYFIFLLFDLSHSIPIYISYDWVVKFISSSF
jgi:hypothetical protein